jgi:hypothetical protein
MPYADPLERILMNARSIGIAFSLFLSLAAVVWLITFG